MICDVGKTVGGKGLVKLLDDPVDDFWILVGFTEK